jgi:Cyclic nucleotide-binding domain/Major Facilitator Superfamily
VSLLRLAVLDIPRGSARGAVPVVRDVTSGLAEFWRMAPPAGVAILAFAQPLLCGALVVLIAMLAVHALGLGGSGVGWLTAAFGAGGLAGGAAAAGAEAAGAVRVTRLGRSFIAGMLLWGVPLALLALASAAAPAYVVLVVIGVGNAVIDVSVFTLVTRLAGPRTAGKALGALEFVALAGLATGSILTPLLLDAFGVRGTLALLGGGLAALALAHAVRFRRLDQAMPAPGPETELLLNLPMFAPLPLAVTDLLAAETESRQFPAGAVVIREGEVGAHFHLIIDGAAAVSVHGAPRPSLHRGDCFGEIALLRDIPRTATITAEGPLRTLALGRDEFLTAVTGNSTSKMAADALAEQRLSADSPPHFPIRPKQLGDGWTFTAIEPGHHELEGFSVHALEIPHKGGRTFGCRVSDGSATLAYLPDHSPISLGPRPGRHRRLPRRRHHADPGRGPARARFPAHRGRAAAAGISRPFGCRVCSRTGAARRRPATRAVPPRPVAHRCRNRRLRGAVRDGAGSRLRSPRRHGRGPSLSCGLGPAVASATVTRPCPASISDRATRSPASSAGVRRAGAPCGPR